MDRHSGLSVGAGLMADGRVASSDAAACGSSGDAGAAADGTLADATTAAPTPGACGGILGSKD